MKKKTKIIIASCVLGAVVIALVTFIIIYKLTPDTTEQGTDVWNEKPFDYSQTIQTYSEYAQPFATQVSELRDELKKASDESGEELSIVSAYMTDDDTPTLIVAYDNPEGGNNIMICKYHDSKLYNTYINGGDKKPGDNCDLIIVQGSDVIAWRTGLNEDSGSQDIYDYDSAGKYSSVCVVDYDTAPTREDMDTTLSEYTDLDTLETLSYSSVAVTEDVDTAIDSFLQE